MQRPRIRQSAVFAALALAASTHPSLAQEAEDEPQATVAAKIVVTANRQESPADAVGSSVTVITAEEIEARGKITVAELLRTVPGTEVVRGGGSGQITSVFLRGGNSSHTLVLLDGVRVNSTTTGAFDFADLAADQIERIEVVRGPQSALYGSEAVAGVVSITTRRATADGFRFNARAEAGGDAHQRYQASVDGTASRFDYNVSFSDLTTDSVSVAASGVEDDPHESSTFASRLGFDFSDDGRVDLSVRAFRGDVANDGFDFALGPVDDLNRLQKRDGVAGSVQVAKTFGRVRQKVLVGFQDDELSGSDPDNVFSNFTIDSRSAELTLQADVDVNEANVLTLGASYEDREGGSAGNFDESLDIRSLFVQNAFSRDDRFYLTAGARHDEHSEFGGETTYRLSSAWKPGSATRLHGSFGTGFRAPTLNDLFFPFFSNPDLEPERSRSYDFGVEHQLHGDELVVDVTFFDTDFENLIVFDFVTFLPQNLGEAESKGVEVALDYRPGPAFQLSASYTWNETEDLTTGRQLARRPEHRGVVSLFFRPTDKLRANATLIAVSGRIDSDGSAMDDYERVDLAVQYRFSHHFEPYLRVENLLDEDYEEVNAFSSPGVQAVVGLGLRF